VNRTVLLTGASGFVGRQVHRALCGQFDKVRVVVREGKQGSIVEKDDRVEILTSRDIFSESLAWWENACADVDTVIHVAWFAEPGKYLQSEKNLDCLAGTLMLAKASARAGIRRFVGIGTCFEYDTSLGYVSVKTSLKPTTPYAASKAATYLALSEFFKVRGIGFVWCRLFYLHGEGEDERRLVPYLRARLSAGQPAELSGGDQIRDFMDVSVAGQKIVEVSIGHRVGAVNVCTGHAITVRQLAEQVADQYGRRDLLRFGSRPDNLTDPPCLVGLLDHDE